MMKKATLTLIVAMMVSVALQCIGDNGFALVKNSKPTAVFLVTKEQAGDKSTLYCNFGTAGSPSAKLSAIMDVIKNFNEDLKECTGVEIPVTDADDGKIPVIRFALESRTLPDEDRFSITFPDSRTMLITGSAFAPRWALNHILEKFAGVRWLGRSKNAAHFPKITNLIVPLSEINMASSFNLDREAYIPDAYWFGRSYSKCRIEYNHGLPTVAFPVKKYMAAKKWPEFIFPTINGKKFLPYLPLDNPRFKNSGDYLVGWQPCLTNKETVDEAVKNICEYFDQNPDIVSISLGINDMGGFCQCENCKKLGGLKRTVTGHLDYSELYYKWVNQIAEAVAKKYPDKYFGCLAYREVITPPDLKLHKNIVPFITFDAYGCMDPKVRNSRIDLIKAWSKKATNIGWWDYAAGSGVYDLPRVYFGLQQEMMKIAYANNIRGMFIEAEGDWIDDGPKMYLYNKLMWNINADFETILKEWYDACVGKEASPYLAEYFNWWEKFWREEAVKTDWFQSSKEATYLNMGNKTYLYAVGREDMPNLRRLMEKIVELSGKYGDKRQQLRAKWLMREFEYSEACVYANGGQIFPHSGAVENAEQALEYLKSLLLAVKYDARSCELWKERKADPDLGKGFGPIYMPSGGVPGALSKIAALSSNPKVLEGLKEALQNRDIPTEIRELLNILVKLKSPETVNNILPDGSFENASDSDGWTGGKITAENAYSGKNSYKVCLMPGTQYIVHKTRIRAKPGKYLVSAAVFIKQDHPDVEERIKMIASAQQKNGGPNFNAWFTPEVYVKPGEWTRLTLVVDIPPGRATLGLNWLIFENYSMGDVAYIDDVVIVPLTTQSQPLTAPDTNPTKKATTVKSTVLKLDLGGDFNALWTQNWICYDKDAVKQIPEGRSGQCLEVITADKPIVFRETNFLPLIIGKDTIKIVLYIKGKGTFYVSVPIYNKDMKQITDIKGVPLEIISIDSTDEWVKKEFIATPALSGSTENPSGWYAIQIWTNPKSSLRYDDLEAVVEHEME